MRAARLCTPANRARRSATLTEAVRTDRPFQLEYRLRDPTGAEHWIWEQGQAMPDSTEANAPIAGFMSDVTDRRRDEEDLRGCNKRYELILSGTCDAVWDWDVVNGRVYHTLMELLPSAVYTCDGEGRITFFNEWAVGLWGSRPKLGETEQRFCGALCLPSVSWPTPCRSSSGRRGASSRCSPRSARLCPTGLLRAARIEGILRSSIAGWSSQAARRAHNPKVVGSNPAPATK